MEKTTVEQPLAFDSVVDELVSELFGLLGRGEVARFRLRDTLHRQKTWLVNPAVSV